VPFFSIQNKPIAERVCVPQGWVALRAAAPTMMLLLYVPESDAIKVLYVSGRREFVAHDVVRKTPSLFGCFLYVCPEPVLVKQSSIYI
jgi:hypothetical protein